MANTSLDFGADNGTSQQRYYTLTLPALPNADWCIGFWFREDHTWSGRDYVFEFGEAGSANSLGLSLASDDSATWPKDSNGDGPGVSLLSGGWTAGVNNLVVLQRRGSNLEFYVVAKGASSVTPAFSSAHGFTAGFTSVPMTFGSNAAPPDNFFTNPLGELFILTNDSLSSANVVTLAAGAHITAVKSSPLVDLRFRTSATTETNLGTGGATYNATQHGTSWTTATEFFTDGAAAATLSSPTSTSITSTTATLGATTNQGTSGSNNAYAVWSTTNGFSGVTGTQVKAGQNAAGSTSGVSNSGAVAITSTAVSIPISSLTGGTTYYYAIVQNNANGDSNVLTGSFTTSAATRSTAKRFVNGSDSPLVSTSINWFLTSTFGGTVLASGTTSTDANGDLLLSGLTPAAGSYLLSYKLASNEDHNGTARVTLV